MKATPSLIVKQIKSEKEPLTAIGYLADLIVEVEDRRCDEQDEVLKNIEDLSKHIKGNSDPKKGLLSRFDRLEDRVQVMIWVGSASVLIILGWLINSVLGLI